MKIRRVLAGIICCAIAYYIFNGASAFRRASAISAQAGTGRKEPPRSPNRTMPSGSGKSAESNQDSKPAATTPWNLDGVSTGIPVAHNASGVTPPDSRVTLFESDSSTHPSKLRQGDEIRLPLTPSKSVTAVVRFAKDDNGVFRVAGRLTGVDRGTFVLSSRGNSLNGQILLPESGLGYEVSSRDDGITQVRELLLSDLICAPYPEDSNAGQRITTADSLSPAEAAPLLSSRSNAEAVLYLDFDGETVTDPHWNGGSTIVAAPCTLSSSDIVTVWQRVKEDYWAFNVDVTTDRSRYDAAPIGKRMRVIITPTSGWYGSAGGVAAVGSFALAGTMFSSDIPCWVFNTSLDGIAQGISHELGHTLGLHHDGRTTPPEEYYSGHGTGSVSWGPIMGAAYGKSIVQWSKGEYAFANQKEDDIAIIASATNGFGYVADDCGDTVAAATVLTVAGSTFSKNGAITSSTDQDVYQLTVAASTLTINVSGPDGPGDLDVQVDLMAGDGSILETSNPDLSVSASIVKAVSAGTYYIRIKGVGRGTPSADGYTDGYSTYGSIGQYSLTGSVGAPPTAPSINTQPQPATVYVGDSLGLYVNVAGSYPFTYQWQKNGVNIPGASDYYYGKQNVTLSDSGNYRVIVTNAGGSVTSSLAAVTVQNPPPPTWIFGPYSSDYVEGSYISLYCGFSGSGAITYQWYKNGVSIAGATSSYYNIPSCTFADDANYNVIATNVGGTATSQYGRVKVIGATLPTFYSQPGATSVEVGSALYLYAGASSNSAITYQWYHNGVAITGATYSSISISEVKYSDAGNYNVVASTKAGSAASTFALVTVVPVKPPVFTSNLSSLLANIGGPAYFYIYATATGTITYQWYKDGVAIPGATSSSLNIYSVKASDFAEYYVTVTNSAGTSKSSVAYLDPYVNSTPPGYYWSDAQVQDGVAYFMFKNPARIARYDFATSGWLPDWTLRASPTAFAIAPDGIYVSVGKIVYKYDRNFANESLFITEISDISGLQLAGANIILICSQFYSSSDVLSYNRVSGTKVSVRSLYGFTTPLVYSATQGALYSRSNTSGSLASLSIGVDGTLGASTNSVYLSNSGAGSRPFLLDGGSAIGEDGGGVFNGADLTLIGGLGGPTQDITPSGPGYVALKRKKIKTLDFKYRETGSYTLESYANRVWTNGDVAFAFTQPANIGQNPSVQKILISTIQAPTKATRFDPRGKTFVPAHAVIDEHGVVYLYAPGSQNIVRWSSVDDRYLGSIPLSSDPLFISYSASNHTLTYDSSEYELRRIDLSGPYPVDAPFLAANEHITGFESAGSYDIVSMGSSANTTSKHYSVGNTGSIVSNVNAYASVTGAAWSETTGKYYFNYYGYYLNSTPVSASGVLGSSISSPYSGTYKNPIRVNSGGTIVLQGSGDFIDARTMSYLGTLGESIVDAQWTSTRLFSVLQNGAIATIKGRSNTTFSLLTSSDFAGTALRLFALSDSQLLLVTLDSSNYVHYWKLSTSDLSIISHKDTSQIPPAPSADFNGDGNGDALVQNLQTGERKIWTMSSSGITSQVSLPTQSTNWQIAAVADFNNDDQSDIVWQNTSTGERVIWLMAGTSLRTDVWLPTQSTNWQIVGAADFNHDGFSDLLWQNKSTGERIIWLMNGTTFKTDIALPTRPIAWQIVGTGDLDHDGESDIFWQNITTGQRVVWLMKGVNYYSEVSLDSPGTDWQIGAVQDFNGDGYIDILDTNARTGERMVRLMAGATVTRTLSLGITATDWAIGRPLPAPPGNPADFNQNGTPDLVVQNVESGERSIWLMNGTNLASTAVLPTQPTEWQIAATADFNGDNKADILWQNTTTGQRVIWLMDGTTFIGDVWLPTQNVDWQIAATGDFNADGQADIVWQNKSSGQHVLWIMNHTQFSRDVTLPTLSPSWQVVGTGDLNRDGNPDIILQNTLSGQRAAWLLNGTGYVTTVTLQPQSNEWQIGAVQDVNGDGYIDLVEQNIRTGERAIRFLSGVNQADWASLGNVDRKWVIGRPLPAPPANSADFNEDRRPDLFVQNLQTGARSIWLLNGTTLGSQVALPTVPSAWEIATTGDFNGDGAPDLVWQNRVTGARVIWLMDQTQMLVDVGLPAQPIEWKIAAAGDMNQDGKTDLVWQNSSTGQIVIWLMNGTSFVRDVWLPTQSAAWQIVGAGDFGRSGNTDLFWQNTTTGERRVWLMQGTTLLVSQALPSQSPQWQVASVQDFNGDGYLDFVEQNTSDGSRRLRLFVGADQIGEVSLGTVSTAWTIGRPLVP